MAFRDDEEARKQRIQTLEKELAAAKKEHGEATAAEREQEERRDELGKQVTELEARLREAKRQPEPEPEKVKAPPKPAGGPGPIRRAWKLLTDGFWPVISVCGALIFVYCEIQDCRGGCRSIDRHVELQIPGEVTSASGINMPLGTRCRVHALWFADRDDQLRLWLSEMQVSCGGQQVFDADSENYCTVGQSRMGDGWAYTVPSCSWTDDDTTALWNDSGITLSHQSPSWSYTIRVPSPLRSRQALYDPVLIDSRFATTLHISASVIVISGASPVQPGDACIIDVEPQSSGDIDENCKITVRCDGRTLRSVVSACTVRRGEVTAATGPGVTLDFARGLARVNESDGPGVPYLASLRFTPK